MPILARDERLQTRQFLLLRRWHERKVTIVNERRQTSYPARVAGVNVCLLIFLCIEIAYSIRRTLTANTFAYQPLAQRSVATKVGLACWWL